SGLPVGRAALSRRMPWLRPAEQRLDERLADSSKRQSSNASGLRRSVQLAQAKTEAVERIMALKPISDFISHHGQRHALLGQSVDEVPYVALADGVGSLLLDRFEFREERASARGNFGKRSATANCKAALPAILHST